MVEKSGVVKSRVVKFMVKQSGVERSGVEKSEVEMSFNQKYILFFIQLLHTSARNEVTL